MRGSADQGHPAYKEGVRLVEIPDSYALVPPGQPAAFTRALSVFFSATVRPAAGAR